MLDQPFTLEELKSASASLPNNKVLGVDGLPGEVYKVCGTDLLPELLEVFITALKCGHLPPSMY